LPLFLPLIPIMPGLSEVVWEPSFPTEKKGPDLKLLFFFFSDVFLIERRSPYRVLNVIVDLPGFDHPIPSPAIG